MKSLAGVCNRQCLSSYLGKAADYDDIIKIIRYLHSNVDKLGQLEVERSRPPLLYHTETIRRVDILRC